MTIVIGLHGAKGSGKDYFYQVVKNKFSNKDIRKIAFADPIRQKVMFLFGLKSEEEYDQFKRSNLSYRVCGKDHIQDGRHVVREIGMMMRDYDPNQFTRYVESTIQAAPNSIWCVTDLRFENEIKSVSNALSGKIVKIKRKGYAFDGHVTEREITNDRCDHIIINDSNIIGDYEDVVIKTFENIIN